MSNKHYKLLKKCKICGSTALSEVLKLEDQYLSPTFVKSNENNELSNIKVPITLVLCDKKRNTEGCGLLQLKEIVNPDLLFRNYFYRSATVGIMRRDLKNVVDDTLSRIDLKKGDRIIDIGANDCTMLSYFPSFLDRIGVEPAKNINWDNVDKSIIIVNDYFSKEAVSKVIGENPAKVITAIAMFYDLENPNAIVSEIKSILAPDGILCIQLSYLGLMIKNLNFYDIYHEHLSHYSLKPLNTLMEKHDLKIIDASTNAVNGGSLRVFITHRKNTKTTVNTKNLDRLYKEEDALSLFDVKTYKEFYNRMKNLGHVIRSFIQDNIRRGKPVIGLGASTKGNVLLQFFGIDKNLMPYISERNPDKVSLRTLGTDFELISEEKARSLRPAYMLVLPWYFKKEIVEREQEYLQSGGGLLFPMPYPHIVTKDGEIKLADQL